MPASANPSPAEIVAALQRGGVVEALKVVLAAKGIGPSAGKKVASQVGTAPRHFASLPVSSKRTDLSPGEVPRSSGDIWLLLFLIAAVCTTYYLFAR